MGPGGGCVSAERVQARIVPSESACFLGGTLIHLP